MDRIQQGHNKLGAFMKERKLAAIFLHALVGPIHHRMVSFLQEHRKTFLQILVEKSGSIGNELRSQSTRKNKEGRLLLMYQEEEPEEVFSLGSSATKAQSKRTQESPKKENGRPKQEENFEVAVIVDEAYTMKQLGVSAKTSIYSTKSIKDPRRERRAGLGREETLDTLRSTKEANLLPIL